MQERGNHAVVNKIAAQPSPGDTDNRLPAGTTLLPSTVTAHTLHTCSGRDSETHRRYPISAVMPSPGVTTRCRDDGTAGGTWMLSTANPALSMSSSPSSWTTIWKKSHGVNGTTGRLEENPGHTHGATPQRETFMIYDAADWVHANSRRGPRTRPVCRRGAVSVQVSTEEQRQHECGCSRTAVRHTAVEHDNDGRDDQGAASGCAVTHRHTQPTAVTGCAHRCGRTGAPSPHANTV